MRQSVYLPIVCVCIAVFQLVLYGTYDIEPYDTGGLSIITYAFAHASWVHVIGNACTLVYVGVEIEVVDGLRVLPVWLLSVMLGALTHKWTYGDDVYLVGGSAGVYGIIASHYADVILNYSDMPDWYWVTLRYVAASIPPIAHYLLEEEGISHAAHLGGALGGLIGGFIFFINFHATNRTRAMRVIFPACICIPLIVLAL